MPRIKKDVDDVDEIAESMKAPKIIDERNLKFIPTGSTLLNLALSDRYDGGWACGTMANIIGDSHAGKSILALTTFAEMAYGDFDDYRLIYDDAEESNNFNMSNLFGKKTAKRIEPPYYDEDDNPFNSEMIEDFEESILTIADRENPFAYILDSFDAISSEQDEKKDVKRRSERLKGIKGAGDYNMAKQKAATRVLRNVVKKLKRSGSWCGIVSQTRVNITALFNKTNRSGGKALKFYATHELWMSVEKKIKGVQGRPPIGVLCKIKITKNKITGKERVLSIPIYPSYGIDDYGSCVEFLIEEKVIKKNGNLFNGSPLGLDSKMNKSKIIQACESSEEQYMMLKWLTAETWNTIEESLKLKGRKPKYG